MLTRGSICIITKSLEDWCAATGISTGLVYKQLLEVFRAIFQTEEGIALKTGFAGDELKLINKNGAFVKESFQKDVAEILYPPVVILANSIIRSASGKSDLRTIIGAFGSAIGVKMVKLIVSRGLAKDKIDKLKMEMSRMHDNRVNFSLEVDNKLLDGWILFIDFYKNDNSAFGVSEGVLSLLDLSGLLI